MRKKRTLLICAACVLLAILALLAYNPTSGEPSYGGHPLSFWVVRLGTEPVGLPHDDDQMKQAQTAIDHIGVSALPFLVKWIQYETPQWRVALASPLNRSRFPFSRGLSDLIMRRRAGHLATGTYGAFIVLGPRAMPAFDDLCRLMNQTNAPLTAHFALFNLGSLGTNALPPMVRLATNAASPLALRSEAVATIRTLLDAGGADELAVPALIYCLNDTNSPRIQDEAAYAFGYLTIAPQTSIPALIPHLRDTDTKLRATSATALGRFGSQAVSAIPALTDLLTDPSPDVRLSATNALHQIDPTTFTNTPAQWPSAHSALSY